MIIAYDWNGTDERFTDEDWDFEVCKYGIMAQSKIGPMAHLIPWSNVKFINDSGGKESLRSFLFPA